MHIPKVKSLKDLLLWLPRFVYNLGFKAHAFLVTALAVLPIVLTTVEKVHTPEGEVVKLVESGKCGNNLSCLLCFFKVT